jgi:hypothetical protein
MSIGNIGDIGNIGNIGDIGDIGDIGNIGNIGDIGDIGDIGNIGNIGDIGNIQKHEYLITALAESLSKHGFGGLTSEKLVIDFLENMSCNLDEEEKIISSKIKETICVYLKNNMSLFTNEGENKFKIFQKTNCVETPEIIIKYDTELFENGIYNDIYKGRLITPFEHYEKGTKIIVKISHDPLYFLDNFTELFIHAILSIYESSILHNKKNKRIITPFIIASFSKETNKFLTILERLDGNLGDLFQEDEDNIEYIKNIANEAIFYQTCCLVPLQKDLKFIHGDNHAANVFYRTYNEKRQYFFADFGFTCIEINSNKLCAGYFEAFNCMEMSKFYSCRKDLIQIVYLINKDYLDLYNTDNNFGTIINLNLIEKNICTDVQSIYCPEIYTNKGLENINNEKYSIFDPPNMLKYYLGNKIFNPKLCENIIGPKWNEYINIEDSNDNLNE